MLLKNANIVLTVVRSTKELVEVNDKLIFKNYPPKLKEQINGNDFVFAFVDR